MEQWSNFDLEGIFRTPVSKIDEIIKDPDKFVKVFKVAKRSGGKRKITNPMPELKYLLNGINYRILNAYNTHNASHGFSKGKSVITSAKTHLGAVATGSIDIKDFFDNVKRGHLDNSLHGNIRICKSCKNYSKMCDNKCNPSLYKNKENNYEHKCEEVLATVIPDYEKLTGYRSLFGIVKDVALYKGSTPQGFPTSPNLANIALRGMDKMFIDSFEGTGIKYTRYADDLSFSTETEDKRWLKKNTLGVATSILKAFKFRVNTKKTKYCGLGTRLQVCSVVINHKLSLAKWKVKNFRAELHTMFVKNPGDVTKEDLQRVTGWAVWLKSVNPSIGEKYLAQIKEFKNGRVHLPKL
jgi:RNA-directed DNA polymerase